jgi:predicted PurR-regulated permease PerM
MIERIEKKILEIRKEPEAVRMRYLLLCLGVTMFFVVIIWVFSLKESVNNISQQELNITIPKLPNEEGKSLESLLKNNEALQTKPEGATPQTIFEQGAQQ